MARLAGRLAHGGRRGLRSPARLAGDWVGALALLREGGGRHRFCGNRDCGLRPQAPPPALGGLRL